MIVSSLNRIQVGQKVRRHIREQLYHEIGMSAHGIAIYTLSDPRSIRDVRYVGQTSSPARRFLQHLNTAKLWLPDDVPWWVKSPKLRPLYTWIRELYTDEHRLPVMVVSACVDSVKRRESPSGRRLSNVYGNGCGCSTLKGRSSVGRFRSSKRAVAPTVLEHR